MSSVREADGSGRVKVRGIIYAPYPSQQKFHDLPTRFKLFSGPVGSGKTLAVCQEAVRLAYQNPGCVGVLAAPTYRMLADVTRLQFLGILEGNGVPFRFRKSENSIELPECRHTVRFRSLDEPERLVGPNLAWFGCDELSYAKEDSFRRLEARLRDPRAARLCGFGGCTPNGLNWTWRRFISEDRVAGYGAVLADPFENRRILDKTPDFYERLRASYPERFFRQEVLGEYLSMYGGAVYYSFGEQNIQPLVYQRELPVFWTLDFNLNPLCSLIGQRIPLSRARDLWRIHMLEEIALPQANTPEAFEEFVARTQDWIGALDTLEVEIYGDPAGEHRQTSAVKTDYQILRELFARRPEYRAVFKHGKKAPLVRDRTNTVNGLLCNAAGERRLLIDPRCRGLVADLRQVSWKADSYGNVLAVLDKTDPARTHLSDALGYLCWQEFGLQHQARFVPQSPF
jgi:hypothetical protein